MNSNFKAKGARGEIWLYDAIGASFWSDSISAKTFQKELSALGKVDTINLRINSPGGDVFDGTSIYNQLKAHPAKIIVDIDGVAASIASIVAMAGNSIRIAKNAMLMVHDPQGLSIGNADEMRRTAALLDQVKGNLTDTYIDRTGNDRAQVETWMTDETWFTSDTAVKHGFADTITEDVQVTACFDLSKFHNVPGALRERMNAATPSPVLDRYRGRLVAQEQRIAVERRKAHMTNEYAQRMMVRARQFLADPYDQLAADGMLVAYERQCDRFANECPEIAKELHDLKTEILAKRDAIKSQALN